MALHPFITALLETMKDRPALSAGSPQDARDMVAATRDAVGFGPEMVRVEDFDLPTRGGAIRAKLLVPETPARGLIVYFHGGGWLLGALEDFETLARALAKESGCVVLMPDYRLAPEHPFPAGLEDAEDAVLWAAANAETLTGRSNSRMILAGDSAGGNLTAVVSQRLHKRVEMALQAMIYPVADSDLARESYRTFATGLPLTTRDMEWFFEHYAARGQWSDPAISPIRAESLEGLPPAMVIVAEHDVLADDGLAYAEALRKAGVAVTTRFVPGVTHGFVRLHNLFDIARAEVEALARECAARCE